MINISGGEISGILLILIVSALTQGVMGFGFGIVGMTLLPFTMGLKDAITLLAIFNAVMMALSLYWQKSSFRWKDAKYIVLGSLVGIPIGALLVHILSEGVLFVLLGGTMLFIGINHFISRQQSGKAPVKAWEIPIGIASGTLAAGFNMGGPPIVAYVYSRNWTADQAKAVMSAVFMTTGILRLFFIGFTSENLTKILWLSGTLVLPTAITLYFAIKLGRRIPHAFLRPVVFAYLALVGLYYLALH